ncbi:hypothetical protein LDENG_00262660 [Lucifuga dentata]|nr:hypothetical protein LDENG_00262660 [Lucifuga dentata]
MLNAKSLSWVRPVCNCSAPITNPQQPPEDSRPSKCGDYAAFPGGATLRTELFIGLAKPMGLVEGPGGLGQGGAAATLGENSRDTEGKYEEYGYNAQLSDRISLDRSIPDYRPKK